MTAAYERVLDALREQTGRRVTANGTVARGACPAHDGQSTDSLAVRRIEGAVLLHCHGGCQLDDVLHALKLSAADLYDDPRGQEYRYGDGRTVRRREGRRPGEKRFHQTGNTQGRPILYRDTAVREAVAAGRTVYVVEGEKDVHAVESTGAVATTSPMGAASAHKTDWTPLAGADVVVVADRDDKGADYARTVVGILRDIGAASVRTVEARTGKDAADHLTAGHDLDDLVPVTHDDTPGDLDPRDLFPTLDWHELWAQENDEAEDWIIEPLVPARRLISVYSAPKVGKSLLMLEVAAGIATGRPVLGGTPARPRRVLYVDFENDPRQDIRERLKAMGYGPDDLDNLRVMSFPTFAQLDTHQGGQELLMAAQTWECEVIVIDTVSRAVSGEENANDTWLAFYRHTGLALKQAGLTLIRLDHTGKDARKGQRGGSAKSGDVDAVWKLTKDSKTILTLTCEAHRFPLAEADQELTLTRCTDPLRHEPRTDQRRHAFEAKVKRVLEVLDRAEIPATGGRDKCRAALKERGETASTDVLTEAIRRRRDGPEPVPTLFRTGPDTDLSDDTGDSTGSGAETDTETAGQTAEDLSETDDGQVPDRSHPDLSAPRPTPEGWGADRGDDPAEDPTTVTPPRPRKEET